MAKKFLILAVIIAIALRGFIGTGPRHSLICNLTRGKYDCPNIIVEGYTKEGYESVKEVFASHFPKGLHLGAQFVAYVNGEKVVDVWGESDESQDYNGDTLQVLFSNSKAVSVFAYAMAVDRGYIQWEDKISKYWPQFGKHGKENFTIEGLLRHETGLHHLKRPLTKEEVWNNDWESIAKVIEDTTPAKKENTTVARHYHSITRDWISTILFKKFDPNGRTLGEFVKEEITDVLKIEYYLGNIPKSEIPRINHVSLPSLPWMIFNILLPHFSHQVLPESINPFKKINDEGMKGSASLQEMEGNVWEELKKYDVISIWNHERSHTSEVPSVNGISNARNLAKLALLMQQYGTLYKNRLVSEFRMKEALSNSTEIFDEELKVMTSFTKGGFINYDKYAETFSASPLRRGFFGGNGLGGSMMAFNPDKRVAFAYTLTGLGLELVGDERLKDTLDQLMRIANAQTQNEPVLNV